MHGRVRVRVHWGWEARFADFFHGRSAEAGLAIKTALWGLYVHMAGESMATASYTSILRWLSEDSISVGAVIVGLVYLVALRINGSQRAITSTVRAVAAGLIMSLWVFLLVGFFLQVPASTAVPTYLLFVAAPALVEFARAATDAMRVARGAREVTTWLE